MEELKIGAGNQEYEDYSIENEITRDTIRNAVIRQSDKIEYPMVCINCAIHSEINRFALDGLRCLLDSCKKEEDEYDDMVPVYMNTREKVLEIGRASFIKLSRYLCDFVRDCINEKVKVYYMESQDSRELMNKSNKCRIILNL